ncbi:MAG: hypothetical protein A3A94_00890 [Candidatus Portnoybacteria bacterium RIFCSPLOWO2_01_FULL_43_11]|uniref:Uncharacterized protein n=4 Tax=Candidatus Portnoyibacteriota TaxID=1817913 RepID=A0A1G2FCX1_9BACT|nr:MAG: hypothetical protein A2815_00525 [Candidatus Portnoybacteria bacterium RIFCSPHIGHO2_01_FULL_40_12b]OGZ36265.1 MAG: hypothetical protein A3D38_01180 [Candidatus Portnoybacteria bacterium RIFCSPHIGHO2_02_FULL_40_23]OGZ37736.1 MAG: hypothetical protein A3E90_02785 [Candidatus Portnoybacteria bacterium RIFCSPHIGHO2_12_FULL_40_11]OGZ38638.1 MAG: hypothetical protein A3A94_00890 [Candidatus Portnoybacteria bacterium RIFCSPLOWO2_01_FULL_43_11]OGZ40281.1 MAG: hypothetical protein A3I20_02115 [C
MLEVFIRIIDFIGRLADWIHSWTGIYFPWWIRMLFAIFWDLIDIALRIVLWFLPLIFPIIGDIPGMLLDMILAFFGAMLWGRIGVAQLAEVLIAPIPIIGYLLDLIPVLTIAGFIYRKKYPQIEKERRFQMRRVEMSDNFRRVGTLIMTGLFSISVGTTIYYYIQNPESYRKKAWLETKKEESIIGRSGKVVDETIGKAGEKSKRIIIKGKEYFMKSLEQFDTGVEPIGELKDKLAGLLEEKEKEEEKELTPEQEKEMGALKLGPIERFRYFSDSTLEKAKEIKSRKFRKSLFALIFFGIVDIFFFMGKFPWFGRNGRNSSTHGLDIDDLT